MGEKQEIIPEITNEATQLILGLITQYISDDRKLELEQEYNCKFYHMPDISTFRSRVAMGVSAEDFRRLADRWESAVSQDARNTIAGSVDMSNIVAHLTQFKYKRVLTKNIVLVSAHTKAVECGQGTPWSTKTPGQWYLRGVHRVGKPWSEVINIDWCPNAAKTN